MQISLFDVYMKLYLLAGFSFGRIWSSETSNSKLGCRTMFQGGVKHTNLYIYTYVYISRICRILGGEREERREGNGARRGQWAEGEKGG